MKAFLLPALLAATVLAGCAQSADTVQASYVSPLNYASYSCRQIESEARRVAARSAEVAGVQNQRAQSDAVATAAAVILFWPAAFFIRGDQGNAAELGRLRGELEALELASNERHCGLVFQTVPAGQDAAES